MDRLWGDVRYAWRQVAHSPGFAATLFSVTAFFTAIALLASWLPARRAAAVDPGRALRWE